MRFWRRWLGRQAADIPCAPHHHNPPGVAQAQWLGRIRWCACVQCAAAEVAEAGARDGGLPIRGIAGALKGIVQSAAKYLISGWPTQSVHPRNEGFQGVAGWCPSLSMFWSAKAAGEGRETDRRKYSMVAQTAASPDFDDGRE
jgi:hypothetical protein